ncbi:DUF3037 domain-containing protein [Phytoactinopolyspora halotolerans]|uniref:DUF3037 domain-containing protein n=1 Tax=Phytoactinopolyspora halotolerans TaxID=1981512 RepID=A0A6L9S2W7_9ACTN|nr:DUF3037 domain-containing protein [Phytoactinopolyspora halotolerans]NED98963.1 DUF3037 domain-containing protein [Phytoactinopolyspora halotolerans]
MNGRYPFEYVVLRVVPRLERGEFINAGVIVYCQQRDYLDAAVEVDADRLVALDPGADVDEITAAANAYVAPCWSDLDDPTSPASLGERFRWLSAPRSTVIQPGPVHAGLTRRPADELVRLFARLVR